MAGSARSQKSQRPQIKSKANNAAHGPRRTRKHPKASRQQEIIIRQTVMGVGLEKTINRINQMQIWLPRHKGQQDYHFQAMTKSPREIRNRQNIPQNNKANIVLKWENKPKTLPLKYRMRQGWWLLPLLVNIVKLESKK